ncbi:MAG: hypothetical protein KatS3mg019_1528 [Fimbriimonadales bacterium]|nr:MAG: hypothetical protein KatS3mg019_1528 [Fimbriimonadales bacterium]
MSTQPNYPSDPTPEEWAVIEPALKRALSKRKPIGAPRQYNLYALYCATLMGGGFGVYGSFKGRVLLPRRCGTRWGIV